MCVFCGELEAAFHPNAEGTRVMSEMKRAGLEGSTGVDLADDEELTTVQTASDDHGARYCPRLLRESRQKTDSDREEKEAR